MFISDYSLIKRPIGDINDELQEVILEDKCLNSFVSKEYNNT